MSNGQPRTEPRSSAKTLKKETNGKFIDPKYHGFEAGFTTFIEVYLTGPETKKNTSCKTLAKLVCFFSLVFPVHFIDYGPYVIVIATGVLFSSSPKKFA